MCATWYLLIILFSRCAKEEYQALVEEEMERMASKRAEPKVRESRGIRGHGIFNNHNAILGTGTCKEEVCMVLSTIIGTLPLIV